MFYVGKCTRFGDFNFVKMRIVNEFYFRLEHSEELLTDIITAAIRSHTRLLLPLPPTLIFRIKDKKRTKKFWVNNRQSHTRRGTPNHSFVLYVSWGGTHPNL